MFQDMIVSITGIFFLLIVYFLNSEVTQKVTLFWSPQIILGRG